jgi:hypothetical protein
VGDRLSAGPGPSGADAVAALATRLGEVIADGFGAALGSSAEVSASRAVRSSWGAVRMTLSRSAASVTIPSVPGGLVIDFDPNLVLRSDLMRAAIASVRAVLTPPGSGAAATPDRARLPDDLGVLVLAYEVSQAGAAWRLRVCVPSHTLAALLTTLARPSPRAVSEVPSPQLEALREMARRDPAAIAELLRQWLSDD